MNQTNLPNIIAALAACGFAIALAETAYIKTKRLA
jgi:hypothetical protein